MHRRGLIVTAFAALALQGCAGMSQQECQATDWYTVGYEDGVRGATGDSVARFRKACDDHGIAPDLVAYRAGRDEGLREFCRVQNGFQFGAGGGIYSGTCPVDLEEDFLAAYRAGRELYQLESELSSINHQLYVRNHELEDVNKGLGVTTAALTRPELTVEERIRLVAELNALVERRETLTKEIARLERDAVRSERRLAKYRATLAYHY